jgi:D-aminoacyl-tRNA deacylase
MRAVVQRVRDCSVTVSDRLVGSLSDGLLVYLGVGRNDTERDAAWLCDKVANLRIFTDADGKMNRSVREVQGGVLVVSQFTLFGDAREGRRPSFTEAAPAEKGRLFYELAVRTLSGMGLAVGTGEFQASMEVKYTNMGPVTILLDSEKKF